MYCDQLYSPFHTFQCDLLANHNGDHEDHISDAPAILTWNDGTE